MNKKAISIIVILFGVFACIRYSGLQKPTQIDISQNYISNEQEIMHKHYEDLLSQKQFYVYQQICNRLDKFTPGELILKEEISMNDLEQIIHTLEMEKSYFYVYPPIALTKKNKLLFYSNEQEENQKNQIGKLLINFTFQKEREQTKDENNYLLEMDQANIIKNYDDFIDNYIKKGDIAVPRFIEEQNRINEMIIMALDSAPKTNKLNEMLDYFQKYLIENIEYDMESANILSKGEMDGYDTARYTTHISCILNGKGTCMGISALYIELCRKKNIDAYPMLGTNPDGINHMWVAINLNDKNVIFVDPTYSIYDHKIRQYRNIDQMKNIGYRLSLLSQEVLSNEE